MKRLMLLLCLLAALPSFADEVVASAAGGWFAVDGRAVKDTTWEGGAIVGGETNVVLQSSPNAWGEAGGGTSATITWQSTSGGSGTVAAATTADSVKWMPEVRAGTNTLTYVSGSVVKTAKFAVVSKDIPFPPGSVTVTGWSGKYDGLDHGISVKTQGIANPTIRYASAAAGPYKTTAPRFTDVCDTVVWCTVSADGYIVQTNSATVKIDKCSVTLTSASASKSYDGVALTRHEIPGLGDVNDGFPFQGGVESPSAHEGVIPSFTGSQTAAGSSKNTFDYVFKSNTKASNYIINKVEGTLTVTKAEIDPTVVDPVNPDPLDPSKSYSKYDATYVYDGEGHTINTQALFAVTLKGATPSFSFVPDVGGLPGGQPLPADGAAWTADVPVYTNVGEYVVWYRITAPNYSNFVHAAKVKIYSDHEHDGVLFDRMLPLDFTGGDVEPGNYFLAGDIKLTKAISVSSGGTFRLCLNGHVVDGCGGEFSGIDAASDVSIHDCGSCEHHFSVGADGLWKLVEDGARTVCGGVITGCKGKLSSGKRYGGGIYATGDLVLHKGNIVGNGSALLPNGSMGGGVYALGRVSLYGGSVLGNRCYHDAGLFCRALTMTNGVVAYNVASELGGGIALLQDEGPGSEISGGEIHSNQARYHGGISYQSFYYVPLTIIGGVISNNVAQEQGAAIAAWDEADLRIGGGCISNNVLTGTGYPAQQYQGIDIGYLARLSLSGSAAIEDCIYLDYPSLSKVDKRITIDGALTNESPYRIATEHLPSGGQGVPFTADCACDLSTKFVSANPECVVQNVGSGVAQHLELVHATPTPPVVDGIAGSSYKYGTTGSVSVLAHAVSGNEVGYQWYACSAEGVINRLIVGATSANYSISEILDVGSYLYRCIVSATSTISGLSSCVTTEVAQVSVAKRHVTLTSGTKTDFAYDGQPHELPVIIISENEFVAGEGIATSNWATVTAVTEGGVANTFDYAPIAGTKLSNYDITVVTGKIAVTKATIDPSVIDPINPDPSDPTKPYSSFDAQRIYNGSGQTIDTDKLVAAFSQVMAGEFTVEYGRAVCPTPPQSQQNAISLNNDCISTGEAAAKRSLEWCALGQSALPTEWSPLAPTIKDVGELVVWYRVTSPNYEPIAPHAAKVTVGPKTVTVEMLNYSDNAFFFDGSKTKVPDVVLVDTNELGVVISTENDWTRVYGERLPTGEWPVTLTGRNNYTGSATALFKNIKRPMAYPVIPSQSYNGKTRKPTITIPKDENGNDLYQVVENPGGINAGFYTNVVLRLMNTTDYKWKGYPEDGSSDWTGVFEIRKASNGWSTYPGIESWTEGETPSEPKGRVRYGTMLVAYRARGAAVETETATKPTKVGKCTARFWAEATQNYGGVASREVDFEIYAAPLAGDVIVGDVTVPGDWLAPYVGVFGADVESAATAKGANGLALWESYVAGLDPTDATSQFTATITMGTDSKPVITWSPDLSDGTPPRTYTTYGRVSLGEGEWTPVTDANKPQMKFFKVGVEVGK